MFILDLVPIFTGVTTFYELITFSVKNKYYPGEGENQRRKIEK